MLMLIFLFSIYLFIYENILITITAQGIWVNVLFEMLDVYTNATLFTF